MAWAGAAPAVAAATDFRILDDRVAESSGLALSRAHPHTVWVSVPVKAPVTAPVKAPGRATATPTAEGPTPTVTRAAGNSTAASMTTTPPTRPQADRGQLVAGLGAAVSLVLVALLATWVARRAARR